MADGAVLEFGNIRVRVGRPYERLDNGEFVERNDAPKFVRIQKDRFRIDLTLFEFLKVVEFVERQKIGEDLLDTITMYAGDVAMVDVHTFAQSNRVKELLEKAKRYGFVSDEELKELYQPQQAKEKPKQ